MPPTDIDQTRWYVEMCQPDLSIVTASVNTDKSLLQQQPTATIPLRCVCSYCCCCCLQAFRFRVALSSSWLKKGGTLALPSSPCRHARYVQGCHFKRGNSASRETICSCYHPFKRCRPQGAARALQSADSAADATDSSSCAL